MSKTKKIILLILTVFLITVASIFAIYYVSTSEDRAAKYNNAGELTGAYYTDGTFIPWKELQNKTRVTYYDVLDSAFAGETTLEKVVMPENIKGIGYSAFNGCTSLKTLIIPNKVESISSSAFYGCSSLTTITIPASVIFINDSLFDKCDNLSTIIVDENNPVYDSRNNCNAIIETETNTLVAGCSNSTIPENVKNIGNFAFTNCTSITEINIPDSIQSINQGSYYNCLNLISINIGKNTSSISDSAFQKCINVENIKVDERNKTFDSRNDCNAIIETKTNKLVFGCGNTIIPEDVTYIGGFSFEGNTKLTSINIPISVQRLGSSCFSGCLNLKEITYAGTMEEWEAIQKDVFWSFDIPTTYVKCVDGDIKI